MRGGLTRGSSSVVTSEPTPLSSATRRRKRELLAMIDFRSHLRVCN